MSVFLGGFHDELLKLAAPMRTGPGKGIRLRDESGRPEGDWIPPGEALADRPSTDTLTPAKKRKRKRTKKFRQKFRSPPGTKTVIGKRPL